METLEEVEGTGSRQPRSSAHTSQEGLLVPRDPSTPGVAPGGQQTSAVFGERRAVQSLAVLSLFTRKLPNGAPDLPRSWHFGPQNPLHFCSSDSAPLDYVQGSTSPPFHALVPKSSASTLQLSYPSIFFQTLQPHIFFLYLGIICHYLILRMSHP